MIEGVLIGHKSFVHHHCNCLEDARICGGRCIAPWMQGAVQQEKEGKHGGTKEGNQIFLLQDGLRRLLFMKKVAAFKRVVTRNCLRGSVVFHIFGRELS